MAEQEFEAMPPWTMKSEADAAPRQLLTIVAIALVGGVLTGALGAAFRWSLAAADRARVDIAHWAHQWPWLGILIPVAVSAVAVGLARLITTWVPAAAGSGVQRVEGAMLGEVPLEQGRIVPAKFVSGVLAIGGGLALGREGPTVQMGASIGSKLAKLCHLPRNLALTLQAALAGAGLGVAFNAPLGGMLFVIEEATKRVSLHLMAAILAGGVSSIMVARVILGDHGVFVVPAGQNLNLVQLTILAFFGIVMGVLGSYYNKTVLWWLRIMNSITKLRPEIRAAIVGGAIGAIGWFAPGIIGGGDNLAQQMFTATPALLVIVGLLAFRWIIGPLSYSLGTAGGLFSPLLAVGAIAGALFATAMNFLPGIDLPVALFAFTGMAGMFTGVVRAPLTGAVICAEMAMTFEYLVPSLAVSLAALVTATLLRSEPIYTTLLGSLVSSQQQQEQRDRHRRESLN